MDDYQRRKQQRTKFYMEHHHGYKKRRCIACNGSGRYDSSGSPPCASCNGTGKERYKDDESDTEAAAVYYTINRNVVEK